MRKIFKLITILLLVVVIHNVASAQQRYDTANFVRISYLQVDRDMRTGGAIVTCQNTVNGEKRYPIVYRVDRDLLYYCKHSQCVLVGKDIWESFPLKRP